MMRKLPDILCRRTNWFFQRPDFAVVVFNIFDKVEVPLLLHFVGMEHDETDIEETTLWSLRNEWL
jgi:hypothetical protein